jgi:hypothetical protein
MPLRAYFLLSRASWLRKPPPFAGTDADAVSVATSAGLLTSLQDRTCSPSVVIGSIRRAVSFRTGGIWYRG